MHVNESQSSVDTSAIVAVYPTHAEAEAAWTALREAGFAAADISVVAPRGAETAALDQATAPNEPVPPQAEAAPAIGVALGWLVNVGAIAASGAMLVAAGPILFALRSVSEALLGVADALVGLGFPADEARRYEDRVRGGAVLLSVHANDSRWIDKGKQVFERTGAQDITSAYLPRPAV